MNDLAEKALHGLDSARRQIVGHPATSLAAAGLVVSAFAVIAGGAVAAARPTRILTAWFGLLDDHGWRSPLPATLLLAGVGLLVALWLLTLEVVRRTAMPESRVWFLLAAYAAPFALGPPLMDTSVYSYAAFGFVQRAGRDPHTSAPTSLGDAAVVDAIEPAARGTVSAAGPFGSILQHLAIPVGGGTALGAVIVLRVVGVVAAVAIARLAADLAADVGTDSTSRPLAIVLCGLNPLVLLYVVSSPHLEGPMLAAVLAALVAVRRRRWLPAVALAAIAGSINAPALVVVPVVIIAHALARRAAIWRVLLRDIAAAIVVVLAAAFVQPHGFGWIGAVSAQFSSHTPYAIPYAVGRVLAPIVEGASFDDLAGAGRLSAATAAACAVIVLLISARQRSVAATAGFALLAMALLAPNLYPWYLLWGLLCLAPAATGDRRLAVLALTAAGCLIVPPGWGSPSGSLVTAGGLAIVALPLLVLAARRRAAQRPPETSRTAGRTSAR